MSDRKFIIPAAMQALSARTGYVPGVLVGNTLYCAGQVGRTPELEIITDPEQQFIACWRNLELVLNEAGCDFDDVVEMTTYHIDMAKHMAVFRHVKDKIFPRGRSAWTCIGVASLAHPGLLVEIKCIAIRRP
ncbi:RidA family protein [Pantoea sp. NPDC088449]|uniref:RidA family protein n=1 Tax=unclassified Pantoea TaxID=2630326 RepID=UPI0031F59AF7